MMTLYNQHGVPLRRLWIALPITMICAIIVALLVTQTQGDASYRTASHYQYTLRPYQRINVVNSALASAAVATPGHTLCKRQTNTGEVWFLCPRLVGANTIPSTRR